MPISELVYDDNGKYRTAVLHSERKAPRGRAAALRSHREELVFLIACPTLALRRLNR